MYRKIELLIERECGGSCETFKNQKRKRKVKSFNSWLLLLLLLFYVEDFTLFYIKDSFSVHTIFCLLYLLLYNNSECVYDVYHQSQHIFFSHFVYFECIDHYSTEIGDKEITKNSHIGL